MDLLQMVMGADTTTHRRVVVLLVSVDQLDPTEKVLEPEKLMTHFQSVAKDVRTWEVPRVPESIGQEDQRPGQKSVSAMEIHLSCGG